MYGICGVVGWVRMCVGMTNDFILIFLRIVILSFIVAYSIDDVVLSITDNDVMVTKTS